MADERDSITDVVILSATYCLGLFDDDDDDHVPKSLPVIFSTQLRYLQHRAAGILNEVFKLSNPCLQFMLNV